MLRCHVPTNRKKLDWKEHIKTERDYRCAADSGIGWVVFEGLPLTWEEAKKRMNGVRNEVTNEVNNEEGSDGKQ